MTGTVSDGSGRNGADLSTSGGWAGPDPSDPSDPSEPDLEHDLDRPSGRDDQEGVDLLADWGLFGPGTMTWRVHSDPLVGIAMLRSLALRVLHPQGSQAVLALGSADDEPWDRLAWGMRNLAVVTFGSGAEIAVARARTQALLLQIGGPTASGGRWSASDPDLLLWSYCCQVASLAEVTRRGGTRLGDAEHDLYLREQCRLATAWGLEPDEVPSSRADLTRYFRLVRSRTEMTHAARAFLAAIVDTPEHAVGAGDAGAGHGPSPHGRRPGSHRPVWAPAAGLAFAALPAWARRMYGARPSAGAAGLTQAATTVALHSLRDSLRWRPDPASG